MQFPKSEMANFKPIHLITSPFFLQHDTGLDDHPEQPERLASILSCLEKGPLATSITQKTPRAATRQEVTMVHDEDYLLRFEDACLSGREYFGHTDNRICYETWQIAFLAAGAGLTGVDLLESASSELIFCAARPPGHHAEAGLPLGFCFFNNVAIPVRYWQEQYGKERILIFDFDAHHGNGIQEIFDEDSGINVYQHS